MNCKHVVDENHRHQTEEINVVGEKTGNCWLITVWTKSHRQ